jgi:predicted glycosyltransferase involved in capsule biosynthesis
VPYQTNSSTPFSAAEARNQALARATGTFVLFWDVDLGCTEQFWPCLFQRLTHLAAPQFLMLPCLYLTRAGTRRWHQSQSLKLLRDSFLQKSAEWVHHVAICSSAVVLQREYALSLGGFRPHFSGHGFEDFEFLHRLAVNNPWGPFPPDYASDNAHRVPAHLTGFRAYLARYAFPEFFGELLLVHKFHPIPHTTRYYRSRSRNRTTFLELLDTPQAHALTPFVTSPAPPPMHPELDFSSYIIFIATQNGIPNPQTTGLFERHPPTQTAPERLFRKLRKLILHPRRFFHDAF